MTQKKQRKYLLFLHQFMLFILIAGVLITLFGCASTTQFETLTPPKAYLQIKNKPLLAGETSKFTNLQVANYLIAQDAYIDHCIYQLKQINHFINQRK